MKFVTDTNREKLRSWLTELIEFPTYRDDGVSDDESFQSAIENGFEWLEGWARQRGLETHNWQNRVLEIAGGTGPAVAVATHLDVVPFSRPDWTRSEPDEFHLEDEGEPVYYGRGVIDDKGSLAGVMLAVDQLLEQTGLPVSLRLIVDSAEEVGFKNLRNYFEKSDRSLPKCALVADGFYPMVAGEKGLLQVKVRVECSPAPDPDVQIARIKGGDAFNQVPGRASVRLVSDQVDNQQVADEVRSHTETLTVNAEIERESDGIRVVMEGKTAHGSTPNEGINASSGLIKLLGQSFSFDLEHGGLFSGLSDTLNDENGEFRKDASAFGLEAEDDRFNQGSTSNLGPINRIDSDTYEFGFDFRLVPETDPESALSQLQDWFPQDLPDQNNITVEVVSLEDPLDVNMDDRLPSVALEAYRSVRGDGEPMYIGGRTHATLMPNAFAFGCMEPEQFESYGFHGADERVPEVELLETAEIYAEALSNFAELRQSSS